MNSRSLALLAAFSATTIYGLNHTIAKGIMPDYMTSFALVQLRVIAVAGLFWIASLFGPREKVDPKDWKKIMVCALFGMCINMLAFFKGLQLSTPINSAVLITLSPILVAGMSAILIKEKVGKFKIVGISIGFIGALILILFGAKQQLNAPNIPLGNILFFVNAGVFGLYLILVKKLLAKYHPFTMMKWMFTLGSIYCMPIALPELLETQWSSIPFDIVWRIAFVVIATTFLTYLFNIYALRQLKASTVSAFAYAQPVIGILFAVFSGKDQLSLIKIAASLLVMVGLYLVSSKKLAQR